VAAGADGIEAGSVMAPAVVEYRGRKLRLHEGAELVFGRSEMCDLPIGAGVDNRPVDQMVSSRAGMLKWQQGQLWVLNTSTFMPLHLFAGGEELVVVPKDLVSTLVGRARLELRGKEYLDGRHQEPHRVNVRLPYDVPGNDQVGSRSRTGTEGLLPLDERERLLLTAYCYRLLNFSGPHARPCSHAEVGERLGISPTWAREQMDKLRRQLSTVHGYPGLMPDKDKSGEEGTRVLCRYAVRSGNISEADFAVLEHWERLRALLCRLDRDKLGLSRSGDWAAYVQLTKLLAQRDVDRKRATELDLEELVSILEGPQRV